MCTFDSENFGKVQSFFDLGCLRYMDVLFMCNH